MKRKIVVGVFAALVLILSGLAAAGEVRQEVLKGTLGNLKELGILVEQLGPEREKVGLTREGLADEVLVQLRAKLPRLKIVDYRMGMGECLYLNVNVNERAGGGHYGYVGLSMDRKVIVTATAETTIASVWSEATIFIGPPGDAPRQVRGIIGELVTKFAADYYRAGNP